MHNCLFAEICAKSPRVTIYRKVLDFSLNDTKLFCNSIHGNKNSHEC